MYLCMHASIYSCCSHLEHRASVKRFVSLQFLNLRQSVGLLGRRITPNQGCYLHRTTQTQDKHRQTTTPWVGIEPTIPALDRAKTFHASDRAATVIGNITYSRYFIKHFCRYVFVFDACIERDVLFHRTWWIEAAYWNDKPSSVNKFYVNNQTIYTALHISALRPTNICLCCILWLMLFVAAR
jgi:hypothetical protein